MHDDRPVLSAMMPLLKPGDMLGRYQLLCVVAQGGMGSVWAARLLADHGFERDVAIKTILPQHAEERRFREMFLDEARLASRIIHPNVVQVLDLAEQDGVLFQAMEWVEGDSLRALVNQVEEKGEPIPAPLAVRIVLEVAKGLHAAHELTDEQGSPLLVVHRDVSPHNIMVGLDGSVRISDFGIAKARDRLSPETSQGHIKGKLRYMAPEQALGKPVDRRADIWSLAAILYELLSSRPLFDAPNEAALLYEVVTTPPTLLFEQPVHPRLIGLLRLAFSRSPEGRQPTAEVFANELRRAAKQAGPEATTEDLAIFFQTHLGPRCETRRKKIEHSTTSSVSVPSSGVAVVRRRVEQPSFHYPNDEALPSDALADGGTLSSFARSVESRRLRSLVAGTLLLSTVALAIGWFVLVPHEKLAAQRFLSLRPTPLLVPPPAVSSAPASAPASAPPSDSAVEVPAPPVSVSAARTFHPTKRPPPTPPPPTFEDIDDGF
jgi:eukaryotic-like serine/threonine-protein kinase